MVKLRLAITIAVFGTIGAITAFIPLASSVISFYRGIIASIFLFVITYPTKNRLNFKAVKENFFMLFLTGIILCANWVLQFESFRIASVSIGTVCYNTMSIFLLILAPLIFKEKITKKSIICISIAMLGVILVSNVMVNGFKTSETVGCLYGLLAAIGYALVVILNKKLSHVSAYDKVIVQFFVAAIVVIPYIVFVEKGSFFFSSSISSFEMQRGLILLLILCFVHTGLAYVSYYSVLPKASAQTLAIFTYIDPFTALLLSYFVLHETLTPLQIIGAVLILLATLINEFVRI